MALPDTSEFLGLYHVENIWHLLFQHSNKLFSDKMAPLHKQQEDKGIREEGNEKERTGQRDQRRK